MRATLDAFEMKILSERPDGSGVIEMPILTEMVSDYWTVTADTLSKIKANFDKAAGIVVGVTPGDHLDFEQRGGAQDAFVDALEVRGASLWATIEVADAELFAQIKGRKWRGFSIEAAKGSGLPKVLSDQYDFDGWVLTGGVFTNRPASNTVSRRAAKAESQNTRLFTVALRAADEEEMDKTETSAELTAATEKLAALTAENQALRGRITGEDEDTRSLKIKLAEAGGKVISLEGDLATEQGKVTTLTSQNAALNATNATLTGKVEALTATAEQHAVEATSKTVITLCADAIAANKIIPADVEGHDKDPMAWLASTYVTTDNLARALALRSGKAPSSATSSGEHTDDAADDGPIKLDAKHQAVAEELGLTGEFDGVSSEREARKIFAARAAKKEN